MSYEEFKLTYCYDIPKVQFERFNDMFKQEYCYKENLMEYPKETPRMQYDKFKFIHEQYQKYHDELVSGSDYEVRDFNKEFLEFLKEWIYSIHKKFEKGELP